MRIAVGSDHAGFELKEYLNGYLRQMGHETVDLGAYDDTPSDYPDYASAVAEAVVQGRAERGLVVCGSGLGAAIAANKVPGARAGSCTDTYSARQGVEHDDMNVLAVGSRVIGIEVAKEIVTAFVNARYTGAERHQRRLGKVRAIEEHYSKVNP